ncbi:hypothetical protein AA313_de0204974 [Arthrobotrys entomopaga]|nr:hypothetical protein AA313_de0204974 [Arthrobotrys entomopaga]
MRPIKPNFSKPAAGFPTVKRRFTTSVKPSYAKTIIPPSRAGTGRQSSIPQLSKPQLSGGKLRVSNSNDKRGGAVTDAHLSPGRNIKEAIPQDISSKTETQSQPPLRSVLKPKLKREPSAGEDKFPNSDISPVTPTEYASLLRSLINLAADLKHKDVEIPKRIAIAVSGGIDSMALAHLTSSLKTFDNEFSATEFVAMIVDHRLRTGSDEEADKVAEMMDRFGIKSHRITLDLIPTDTDRTRIELVARRGRYNALAHACREHQINYILTGHHGNDQAETFLMRLIKDSGHVGLAGMAPVAKIPECERVYGADEISVLRPFLGVFKDRLRETLIRDKITWFEDPTNADGTLTVRNAIRLLITPPTRPTDLPICLTPPSLVSRTKRIHLQNTWADENIDWFLSRCTLRHIRSSNVIEAFIPENLLGFPIKFLATVFGRLAEVVTPLDRIEMPQMQNVAKNIVNVMGSRPPEEDDDAKEGEEGGGGGGGERRQRPITHNDKVSEFKLRYGNPVRFFRSAQTENNIYWEATRCDRMGNRPPGVILLCHRQPYVRYSSKRPTDTPEIDINPKNPNEWMLFDGRFWLRYLGEADDPLLDRVVRGKTKRVFITATRKEVMYRFEQMQMPMETDLGKAAAREVKKRLKSMAPGKSRGILPVLCSEYKKDVKQWKVPYRIHGFPTFELGSDWMGQWDWKPKKELVVGGTLIGDVPMTWKDGKMAPISMYSK